MRRVTVTVLALVLLAAASCTPTPPTGPLPDPVIACDSVGGSILYSPPAYTGGPPVTISTLPGAGLAGCSDGTGQGITGGVFTQAVFGLSNSGCESAPPVQTPLATGGMEILWSNLATSQITATIYYGFPYSTGIWRVEMTIATGQWAGAVASTLFHVTESSGTCITPVVTAQIESVGPIVFHPPPD